MVSKSSDSICWAKYLIWSQITYVPLLTIFSPAKGIPEMAASRLQHGAIILSAYNYEVKYQPTDKHGNTDALSRLPLDIDAHCTDDDANDTVCLLEQQQVNH